MLRAFLAHRAVQLALASGPLLLSFLPDATPAPLKRPRPPLLDGRLPHVRMVDTLVDIPVAWRRNNWTGPRGQGSCVHAAMRHLLHWQGENELAEWWARNNADGESFAGLSRKLDAAGVRWAGTSEGDDEFLTWAIRTRRGAAVVVQDGAHMVNLVGLDAQKAYILDSNDPARIQAWDRNQFFTIWHRSGGWAVTPVYQPPPPSPKVSSSR